MLLLFRLQVVPRGLKNTISSRSLRTQEQKAPDAYCPSHNVATVAKCLSPLGQPGLSPFVSYKERCLSCSSPSPYKESICSSPIRQDLYLVPFFLAIKIGRWPTLVAGSPLSQSSVLTVSCPRKLYFPLLLPRVWKFFFNPRCRPWHVMMCHFRDAELHFP